MNCVIIAMRGSIINILSNPGIIWRPQGKIFRIFPNNCSCPERYSSNWAARTAHRRNHRIVAYRLSSLARKQIIAFMKKFRKGCIQAREIVKSGDSDSPEPEKCCPEMENFRYPASEAQY
ncbi:MAG: hypothetical protein M1476_07205 [Candidatus Thermoplasmatota archaeon]|nr:hypothetical protein [Candidatus Thermoplasmatota archaeon]